MRSGTVQEDLLALLAVLHPERAKICELRAAGVGGRRIALLYPPTFSSFARDVASVVSTREQALAFLAFSSEAISKRLETLEDTVPTELYARMAEGIRHMPYAADDLDELCALVDERQVAAQWRLSPAQAVNTALLNAACVLWLAANWEGVASLSKASSPTEVMLLTRELREALDA